MQISNRAKKLLQEHKQQIFSSQSPVGIELQFISPDKILTLQYQNTFSEFDTIILEAFSILLKNRDIKRLIAIDFKEIESFLRDENLTPSADNNCLENLKMSFSKIQKLLIIECLRTQIGSCPKNSADNFLDKIKFHHELILYMRKHFFENLSPVHIMSEHDLLYFRFNSTGDEALFLSVLNDYLKIVDGVVINLVAVKG